MAYQVTRVNTISADKQDFDTWLSAQNAAELLVDFPDAGDNLLEIVHASISASPKTSINGFVSETVTVSDDGLTTTIVEVWESQEQFEEFLSTTQPRLLGNVNCNTSSTTVTGIDTTFTTSPPLVGETIHYWDVDANARAVLGVLSSVDNDTQLTLVDNATSTLVDRKIYAFNAPDAGSHIMGKYNEYLGFFPNVTTANI